MAVKNPQFEINIRKNTNANNPGYGKYYPKAVEKQTISLRGLCNHMTEHNSIYGRDIIEGVLTKMSSCITELLSQGNPVKIDGLGTFVPTVESTKEGITKEDPSGSKDQDPGHLRCSCFCRYPLPAEGRVRGAQVGREGPHQSG